MELATADPNPLIHDLMETMSVGSSSTSSHSGSASFGRGRGALARARNGGAAERHGRPVSPRELVARSSPPGFATKGAPGRGPPPMWSAAQDFAMEETISSVYHNLRETLQLHKLDGYFQLNEEANWTALRNHIPSRGAPELSGMVLDLLRVLEDLRISFEQVPLDDADNMYDRSITSNVSTASLMRPPVHETHQVELAVDQEGHRMINCYTVLANLGRGSYGKVKLGEEVGTGKKVAIKIIDKRHLNRSYDGKLNANASDALTREITIMKKVRHRNCVSLLEVIDDPEWEKLYLVMDYIPNGPIVRLKQRRLLPAFLKAVEAGEAVQGIAFNRYLCRFATRQTLDEASVSTPLTSSEVEKTPTLFACKSVPQSLCTIYLRQLVSGLRYLHKRNVVHHDIKPDNILLGLNNNVYLTDFGVSEIFHPSNPSVGAPSSTDTEHSPSKPTKSTTMSFSPSGGSSGPSLSGRKKTSARLGGGTILFTAPELFSTSSDNVTDPFMTDVWALGITLYSMLVGIAPFFGECFSDIRDSITTKPFPWNGMSFENDPLIPQWKDILDGLLSKDPAMRWSLRQLKDYLESTPFQTAIEKQAVVDQARAAASASSAEHHNRRSPRRDIWSSNNNNNNNSMSILGAALGAKNNSAARQRRLGAAENGANEDDEPAATNTNIAAKRSAVPLLEVSDDRPPRLSSVAGSSLNKVGLFNGDRNNHDYHAHSGNLLKSYMQNTTSMRPRLDNQSDPLSFLRAKSLGNNKNATSPRSSKVATVGGAMAGTQLSAKSKAVIVRFVARIREKVQQREGKYFSDAQPRRGSDASSEFDSQEMDNMRIAITSQSPRVVAGAARWNSVPSPERDRQLMQTSYNYASSPLDPYVEAGRSAGMESIDAMLSIVNLPSSNSVSVSSSTASLFRRPPVQRTPTEKQQNFFDAQNNSVSLSGGMESPPTLVSPPAQPRSNTSPGASPQKQNAEQTKPATGGTTATRYSQGTSRSAAGNRPARGGPTTTPPSGSPNSTQPRHPLRPPHTHIPSNGLFPDKKEPRVKDGDRSSLPSSGPSSPTDPLVSNSSGSGKSTSGSKDRQTTRRVRAATSTARRGTSQNDRTNPVVPPKKESQSVNIPENISGANEQRLLRKAKSRTASRRTSQDRQPLAK